MERKRVRVDFFHDVVCSWCYVLSPRLRILTEELNLDVYHHSFALSATEVHMVQVFGSKANAKKVILGHWQECVKVEDRKRINVEGMRQQSFEYPISMPGLLGCKAAEKQAGQQGHWDYFDAVQGTHLTDNRNIGDSEVLVDLAHELGLDIARFKLDLNSSALREEVEQDRLLAQDYGINGVPCLVINQGWVISGAQPLDALRHQLQQIHLGINAEHFA